MPVSASPPPPPQAFLSYSRGDLAAADELRERLRAAGIGVFKDDASIRAGDRWMDRLGDALTECASFVVLVGRDGIARWVGAETEVALTRHFGARGAAPRLPIVPVLLESASPDALPPFLSLFQAVSWSPGRPLPDGLCDALRDGGARFAVHPLLANGECPYLGLAAFRLADSHLFFGRTAETLDALAGLGDTQQTNPERLHGAGGPHYRRWLEVAGNSGSGKSSLVQAGLLPMVERGALWPRTGYARWRILGPMMPGRDPVTNLAEALEHGLKADAATRDIAGLARRLGRPGAGADDAADADIDADALALHLRNFKADDTAFLLVVDQFEELHTFAEPGPRRRFDALLAHALQDAGCPLFVVSTVRADFLDRIDQLPCLSRIYYTHCERYPLLPITPEGLREAIEMPARLAGLDVSEVATAIVADARDELGALPLAENALRILWDEREGNRLSGRVYEERGRLAGMLGAGADALLEDIERALPGRGRRAALDLLLALTRINPDPRRHTRQRITRDEAVLAAGGRRREVGERVLRMLSGERPADAAAAPRAGVPRLVSLVSEGEGRDRTHHVDLIHETLIRARGTGAGGRPVPYWKTLHDHIENNRDRDVLRQQLALQVDRWRRGGRLTRWLQPVGWFQLLRYRRLRVAPGSAEGRFLRWAGRRAAVLSSLLALAVAAVVESAWWASANNLPIEYAGWQLLWYAGLGPIPRTKDIPPGEFTMGCLPGRDDVEGAKCGEGEARTVKLERPCAMGVTEVTFREYDYYVWSTGAKGAAPEAFADDAGFGRGSRPVVNVSWDEAQAYVEWLSARTGQTWRLPSEAEWEYAARAATGTAFWWGREAGKSSANCNGCDDTFGMKTAPVGSYPPNPWGLHDTAGNVWEWVADDAWAEPGSEPARAGPSGVPRVLRGGSWAFGPRYARAAARLDVVAVDRGDRLGFRVCRGSPIE